jgi:hypothetical protein
MKKKLLFPLAALSAIALGAGLSQVGCSGGDSSYQVTDTKGQLHAVDIVGKSVQKGVIDVALKVDGKAYDMSYDPSKVRVKVTDTSTGVAMWIGFDRKAQELTATEDFQYVGAAERTVGLQHLNQKVDLKRAADVLSSGFVSQATNWGLMLPLIKATDDHVLAKLDSKSGDEIRQLLDFLVSFDLALPYNPYTPINDTLASSGSGPNGSWSCPDAQPNGICCPTCTCPVRHFWSSNNSVCGGGSTCCSAGQTAVCVNCGCGHLDADLHFVSVNGEGCVTYGRNTGCYQ